VFGFISAFGEVLTLRDIIGGLIILAAVILTNQINNSEHVKEEMIPLPD
jgi:drug/metabolite transporter (DMT)-like permease